MLGKAERSGRRRRVRRRHLALAVAVLAIGLSERFDGPFTAAAVGGAVVSAVDDVVERFDSPPDAGEIHLTFDDGPSAYATAAILDLLAEHDATAVFFPIGNRVDGGAELLQRAVSEGHRIGNHTWSHDSLVGLSQAQFDETVGRSQDVIEHTTGAAPTCLRPPGGATDDSTRAHAAAAGLTVEMWTVDPEDWRRPGRRAIEQSVLDAVEPGSVVLLHDGGGDRTQTVAALGHLLDRLADRGYRFTALPGC